MRKLLSILFLLFFSIASAQKQAESIVTVKALNSKFQFVNKITGVPVNDQLWDETDPFINGYARVFLNNKFSFVNGNGKLIHPVEFDDARNFSNALAAVKKDGKWSFIDESGKPLLPFTYTIVFDFEQSVTVAFDNKKWWLINDKGEVIMPLDISVCYGFKNGTARVSKNGMEGIMDTNGKIIFNQFKSNNSKPISYHPHSNNLVADCPDNVDFENGDFFNWECFIGQVDSVGNTNVITVFPSPPTPNRHVLVQKATPSLLDPYGLFPTNPPDGSTYCVKLGNTNVGAEAERVRYTIHVPLNDSNFSIKYDYAVVLQDPGHTSWTQPRFNAKILDSATNTYIDCASFEYISTSNLPGFAVSPVNSSVIYKPWASVFFSFRGYAGKTMYLEFTTADCVRRAHWGYAYLDVQSSCGEAIDAQYDCNFPNLTILTAPPGFQTYNWWDSGFTTIIGTGQQLILNPGPTINTVFWVEMIPFLNFGCTDTLKATITGALSAQFTMSPPSGCAPHTVTFYNSNIPSSVTLWDFGDGNTGIGDTVTHTYMTPGTYTVQLNVTTTSGCSGSVMHNVIVRPQSSMNQPIDRIFCPNAVTSPIAFTSPLSGTIYSWTNDNTAIGLAASGNGNIPSFTTTNPGNLPIMATIIVWPSTGGCPGPSKTFTITIRPTPHVVPPANQILCNGGTTNAVIMAGTLASTLFLWTNDNTSIGLGPNGNGNILPFTAINNTNAPVTANITVTPYVAACPGPSETFTITVNPTPDVVQPANQTLCSGATVNAITFTGAVSGTTFNWTNSNTSIGLAASGTGNIASFTAINTTTLPVTATITVTPTAAGCPGTPETFTIIVNPTPDVVRPADQTLCSGTLTNAITFTGAITGTAFNWTNSNTAIGLAASGTGNIPAFTTTNTTGAPIIATITVTPSTLSCTGTPQSFNITVHPTPDVVQPADQTLCNGAVTNAINFTGAITGTGFNWTNNNPAIGLAASGTGSIPAFTATNTTGVPIVATITVTPFTFSCTGAPKTFTITVKPTPDVVQPANQILCNGAITNAIAFTGSITGTAFNWTNNNTSIGLAAGGNGNISAFTAINTTNAPVTATITVTPSAAGCTGTPETFTITVNPTPNVVQPVNQTLCNGATVNAITFTGAVSGTTFNWTNNNNTIGLAASGTGNIASFTATNTTNLPVTATITVTPTATGCPGTPETFTITVNPTPNVAQPVNQALCSGITTNAVSFTGTVNGTAFNWTNSNPAIGLAASGTGNIPAFIATNTTGNPIIATITVTPSALGCTGTPRTFTITVNPTPSVLQPPNQTLCNGSVTNAITFAGSVSSSVYNWVNTAPSIGLPASGSGNIAPFTVYGNGNSVSVATITVTPTAFGCTGPYERFTITINPVPSVVQPPNQALCNKATTNLITLTGPMNNAATYSWSNNNPSIGLAAAGIGNIPSFTAINAANTDATALITIIPSTNFCAGAPKTFTITVHPTPSVVASNDMNVCLGSTAQLSATGAAQYSWSPAIRLSCTNCPNPVATPIDNITYTVRGTSAFGCMADDTIKLSVIKPFQMLVTPNDTLCIGESTVLAASGARTYLWSPPAGLNRVDIASPTARPNVSTLYRVIGYDGYGCFTDTSSVMITVGPRPLLNIGPDLTLSTGSTVQLHPVTQNGPIVSWTWTPAAGLSCTNCPAPILTINDNRYYVLSIKNTYGCITNDTIFIFTFCKSAQVFIPNAFTPDGDGLNDVLMIRGKGILIKTFRIFNRWGELVFERTNFNPNDLHYAWDGKVRGVPATPDVFVYTAEVICDNGIIYTYKGNTTLLK